ncbi:MAG: hypothetical protein ACRCVH_08265 [Vagococcus fluvialis]
MNNEDLPVCFKCKATVLHDDSKFCHKCGFVLNSNFCSNDHCYVYNNGEQIALPEDARYCDSCGNETYYLQDGLLEPVGE